MVIPGNIECRISKGKPSSLFEIQHCPGSSFISNLRSQSARAESDPEETSRLFSIQSARENVECRTPNVECRISKERPRSLFEIQHCPGSSFISNMRSQSGRAESDPEETSCFRSIAREKMSNVEPRMSNIEGKAAFVIRDWTFEIRHCLLLPAPRCAARFGSSRPGCS